MTIVAAIAENGVIGRDNGLVWRLRSDLRRFRDVTVGKPVIMGRKTFTSIGRPLPGRDNIVLTRDPDFAASGVAVAGGWAEAKRLASEFAAQSGATEIAIIGGAEIYRLALPDAVRLRLTVVHASPKGDVVFPPYDPADYVVVGRDERPAGPDDEHPFTFLDLERRPRTSEA